MNKVYKIEDEVLITNMDCYHIHYYACDDSLDLDPPKYEEMQILFDRRCFNKQEDDILMSLQGQQINLYMKQNLVGEYGRVLYLMFFNAFIDRIEAEDKKISFYVLYKQQFTKYESVIKSKIRKDKIKNAFKG